MSEIIEGTVKVIVDACFKAGYDKGYQQGRADAIDECISKINEITCNFTQEVWAHTICNILEQLKEQSNA